MYFDANGQPNVDKSDGTHRMTARYDKRGHRIAEAFFDVNGKPMRSTGGYERRTYSYDNLGRKIEQLDQGFDGSEGFASERYRC
jgi:hypothetical protein